MLNTYNPFSMKETYQTEHGLINYRHNLGVVYVTHRRKEHYFIKVGGFAISNTELDLCVQERVMYILILYHSDEKGTIPYRIRTETALKMPEYDNNGDVQKTLPLSSMETMVNGKWVGN